MIPSSASLMHAAIRQAISLRFYQDKLVDDIYSAWAKGLKAVMGVLPTGGGKTVCFAAILPRHVGASCAIAHRQELVGQISLALARFGIRHKIIGPDSVIKSIIRLHMDEVGTNFVTPAASVAVAGVDTLVRKGKLVKDAWLQQVTLQVHDEGHHLLAANKWGVASKLFTHKDCRLLAVTATPLRADGAGLGRHADGVIDVIVEGPGARELINDGYLTGYKVILPTTDIKLTAEMFSKVTGDLNDKGKAVVRGSEIVGDVVKAYQKHTPGRRAIVFASDVETSTQMAQRFRDAGVPSLHVDGGTDDNVRTDAVRKLKAGKLLVLCNVGLFGEGFDLPVVEAVYDTAATESFANYAQRFGRMLRLAIAPELMAMWEFFTPIERKAHIAASAKPFGYYVDLVGNLIRHRGPPDKPRVWTLDRRERRGSGEGDGMPITVCANPDADGFGIACGQTYERFRPRCPFCGFKPEPLARSGPEFVDGDWQELDEETLARMRGEVVDLDAPFFTPRHLGSGPTLRAHNNHWKMLEAQKEFRDAFAWWAGERRAAGLTNSEIFRLFYLTFKIDQLSALALRSVEQLQQLTANIDSVLTDPSKQSRLSRVITH